MMISNIKTEIINFIELYITAFLNYDASYIVDVYDYPMTFFTDEGNSIVFDKEQFLKNTESLLNIYKKLEVSRVGYKVDSEFPLSKNLTIVSIKWMFFDNKEKGIYDCTTRYLYKVDKKIIKISAVFVVDETTKFNQLKLDGKI
jgi:hypothetical protein